MHECAHNKLINTRCARWGQKHVGSLRFARYCSLRIFARYASVICLKGFFDLSKSDRKVIRGEKHHWWPKSLSNYWADEKGLVYRIDVSGKVIPSKPKEFGSISDGHNLLFQGRSSWESTIEGYFDKPDRSMKSVVSFLNSVIEREKEGTFEVDDIDKDMLNLSKECLISLLVRSPRYRSGISSLIESLRGEIPKADGKSLISSNMNQKYKFLLKKSLNAGKLLILYSESDEFIYGDGLFSNLTVNTHDFSNFYSLVPFTPSLSLAWSVPREYRSKPEITSAILNSEQVKLINNSTQIYSKEYLFFRSQHPELLEEFRVNEHLKYRDIINPVSSIIRNYN